MGTNQKYSARLRNKRRINRVLNHLRDASLLLAEMGSEYQDKHPAIEEGCIVVIQTLDIVYTCAENIQAEL
jgi:hypothetical protein